MTAITTTNKQSSIQQFNPEQLKVLQEQLAPKCSKSELDYFIEVCKITGLNPFTREIYAISRNNWNPETRQSEPKMTIQVSIDGLRKRAANSGFYDGSSTFWCGSDGQWLEVWLKSTPPAAAKTIVYRKGCSQPFTAVARFDAYKQEFKNNKTGITELTGLWLKMPDIMIGKCSEALALRKAFPEQTAGLYASEEMDQADQADTHSSASPQAIEIPTGWDNKLWSLFEKGVLKCNSVENFEALTDWIEKQSQKYAPNPEQERKINSIMKGIADEINERSTVDIQPVKSAEAEPSLEKEIGSPVDANDF